jgi:hypothetical protein
MARNWVEYRQNRRITHETSAVATSWCLIVALEEACVFEVDLDHSDHLILELLAENARRTISPNGCRCQPPL